LSACTLAHPSGTSAPPRRDGPIGLAEASFTFGEVSHETTGAPPNLDDSTHAVLTRVLFDIGGSRFGGGADLEFLTSDDDLHQSSGVGTELWQADIFPFFSQRFGGD